MDHFKAPTDAAQVPIVWRYELLKYLRSWRIIVSVLLSIVVLALIFLLPPALGHPYSGTDTNIALDPIYDLGSPIPQFPYSSAAAIGRIGVDIKNMVVYADGAMYPESNWTLVKLGNEFAGLTSIPTGTYAVLFKDNVTGDAMTATFDWRTTPEDFESFFVGFASILIIICATFFGADALVGEFSNRTGYLIFPTPMKRHVLFFGKFMASLTAGLIVIGMFYAGIGILSLIAAHGIDDNFLVSFAYAMEYLLALTAVAYLISSLMKGATGAIVLTFLLPLLIFNIIDGVFMVAGVKFEASLTFSAGVIGYILQDPYPVDTTIDAGAFSFTNYYPDPALSVIVMFAWAIVAVALSLVLFKRKQLSG
jgi:ABC-2 type transport system permease protein